MAFSIYSTKIEKFNFINEIKIKIKGGETQNILNSEFYSPPDEILVNGENTTILSENIITNLNNGENIIIMKWNSKITISTDMFSELNNFIEVDLSNFDMLEIERIDFMFYGCAFLTSINLNNLNAPFLTNMGGIFQEYESILFLDLSSLIAPNEENIGDMFSGCSSLKSINFGNFQTSNVNNFIGLFSSCTSLESIDLSNFETNSVTNMGFMFADCTSLTSLNYPILEQKA